MGFSIPEAAISEGLAAVRWPGRFQDLGGDPKILVDSAHNTEAVRALVQSLDEDRDVVWLFSVLRDKDLEGMVREMLRAGFRFVLVPLDHPRANTVREIEARMPDDATVITASSVQEGIDKAIGRAGKGGEVIVAGSVFLAAAVLEELKNPKPENRIQPFDKAQGPEPVERKPGDGSCS
jgi:dihydrofolate synthase/folylpolyglutamate synthase